ncbi:MAG: hypothetical protein RH942_03135 [Kiloniellaceae bacterium]
MGATDRAQRLQSDLRSAISDNIKALRIQRRAAIQARDTAAVDSLDVSIGKLQEQRDDLSFLSLEALEDSEELRQTIAELTEAADALKDEADNIKTVAGALEKGARIIDQAVTVIEKLRRFVPFP